MGTISSELKAHRERRKISLKQISADTRISLRHLQSLEEGRFDDLPGGMYNRAFIRAYCEALGIDQAKMLRRYEAEVLPRPAPPADRSVPPSHSVKIHPVIIWSLVFIISATGIFLKRKLIADIFSPYFSNTNDSRSNNLPIPSDLKENSSGIAVETAHALQSSVNTPMPLTPPFSLEVAVKEECWIEVTQDDRIVFSKLLAPGETQTFTANRELKLVVGNAGGIDMKINGRSVKPLGKTGEVVRPVFNETTLQDIIGN